MQESFVMTNQATPSNSAINLKADYKLQVIKKILILQTNSTTNRHMQTKRGGIHPPPYSVTAPR